MDKHSIPVGATVELRLLTAFEVTRGETLSGIAYMVDQALDTVVVENVGGDVLTGTDGKTYRLEPTGYGGDYYAVWSITIP